MYLGTRDNHHFFQIYYGKDDTETVSVSRKDVTSPNPIFPYNSEKPRREQYMPPEFWQLIAKKWFSKHSNPEGGWNYDIWDK